MLITIAIYSNVLHTAMGSAFMDQLPTPDTYLDSYSDCSDEIIVDSELIEDPEFSCSPGLQAHHVSLIAQMLTTADRRALAKLNTAVCSITAYSGIEE